MCQRKKKKDWRISNNFKTHTASLSPLISNPFILTNRAFFPDMLAEGLESGWAKDGVSADIIVVVDWMMDGENLRDWMIFLLDRERNRYL